VTWKRGFFEISSAQLGPLHTVRTRSRNSEDRRHPALKARKLAPVASADETRLLIVINEGVPLTLKNRAQSLLAKRDDATLTREENDELFEVAEEIERRGVDRLKALTELAELRGVSLPALMRSLGVAADSDG